MVSALAEEFQSREAHLFKLHTPHSKLHTVIGPFWADFFILNTIDKIFVAKWFQNGIIYLIFTHKCENGKPFMEKEKCMQKRLICWILTLCMVFALCPLPAHAAESNELTIYTYLRRVLGLNEAVACGILANMYYESGFDPKAYNSSGGYYGLCQWGGSRKERLQDYCAGLGLSAGSIEGQLKFIQYELQTNESNA